MKRRVKYTLTTVKKVFFLHQQSNLPIIHNKKCPIICIFRWKISSDIVTDEKGFFVGHLRLSDGYSHRLKDVFPLPLVDDCLNTLAGNIWFTKLDVISAYWQVSIKAEDRYLRCSGHKQI